VNELIKDCASQTRPHFARSLRFKDASRLGLGVQAAYGRISARPALVLIYSLLHVGRTSAYTIPGARMYGRSTATN